jgi:hypothetical protein
LGRVIDRAVKSFGLIAQAGGFGVVALDLADVPMPALRRLPFTTWFRLQRLIEGSQTVGILLAPEPLGRSARGVTVRLGPGKDAVKCPVKGAVKSAGEGAREGPGKGLGKGPREGALEVTRVIWNGVSDCARVLTGFALQPQVQSARRLGDQLRDVASVATVASAASA